MSSVTGLTAAPYVAPPPRATPVCLWRMSGGACSSSGAPPRPFRSPLEVITRGLEIRESGSNNEGTRAQRCLPQRPPAWCTRCAGRYSIPQKAGLWLFRSLISNVCSDYLVYHKRQAGIPYTCIPELLTVGGIPEYLTQEYLTLDGAASTPTRFSSFGLAPWMGGLLRVVQLYVPRRADCIACMPHHADCGLPQSCSRLRPATELQPIAACHRVAREGRDSRRPSLLRGWEGARLCLTRPPVPHAPCAWNCGRAPGFPGAPQGARHTAAFHGTTHGHGPGNRGRLRLDLDGWTSTAGPLDGWLDLVHDGWLDFVQTSKAGRADKCWPAGTREATPSIPSHSGGTGGHRPRQGRVGRPNTSTLVLHSASWIGPSAAKGQVHLPHLEGEYTNPTPRILLGARADRTGERGREGKREGG
jgi:hypothetical protein